MYTPIIKQLNENGTTFYTFSSAARDISRCLADNHDRRIEFTHYVCLNIPDFINPMNGADNASTRGGVGTQSNYSQLFAIGGVPSEMSEWGNKRTSWLVSQCFQSYVLNFEEMLLSESDTSHDRSVAERVFWHWLTNMCAMNLKQASDDKVSGGITRYTEYDEGESVDGEGFSYNKVVKHIGAINVTNNVDIANEAYTEIYIHVPSQSGSTPTVLFGTDTDDVFRPSHRFTGESNYIGGQTNENPQFEQGELAPAELSYEAIYDSEEGDEKFYLTAGNTCETSLVSEGEVWEGYKTDIDGLYVDFDATSYREIMSDATIGSIDEFSTTARAETFEFNAVLVYYDIVDVSTEKRTSNLYGVLFVDDVTSESWDYIQRFPKYKPVEGVQNGNSYGFKLNLRVDVEPNKQGISTLVNEYNTFSLSLFSDAVAKMQECYDTYMRLGERFVALSQKVDEHDNILATINTYNQIQTQINDLRSEIENSNLAFSDRDTILDLIANLTNQINQLVSGNLPVNLTINTDAINVGYGMSADTNTPNRIVLSNEFGGYTLCNPVYRSGDTDYPITPTSPFEINNVSLEKKIYTKLNAGFNMLRIHTPSDEGIICDSDIVIYVNDTLNKWHRGQVMRIVFPELTAASMDTRRIVVKTDQAGLSGEVYGKGVTVSSFGDRPIIELVCLDETMNSTESFAYDLLN